MKIRRSSHYGHSPNAALRFWLKSIGKVGFGHMKTESQRTFFAIFVGGVSVFALFPAHMGGIFYLIFQNIRKEKIK